MPMWENELNVILLFTSMLMPSPLGGSKVICHMQSLSAVGNPTVILKLTVKHSVSDMLCDLTFADTLYDFV